MGSDPPRLWQKRRWSVGDGVEVVLWFPLGITPKQLERMRQYIDCMTREALIPFEEDQPTDAPKTGADPDGVQ